MNLLINSILLHASARLRGIEARKWRLWAAAALGGIYAVCCYLPGLLFFQSWPMKLIFLLLMLLVAFGPKMQTITTGVVFLILCVCLCGLVFFVVTVLCGKQLPSGGIYPVSFPELLLTAGLAYFAGRLVLAKAVVHNGEKFYPIQLKLGTMSLRLTGLYDSGNSLRDPVSGAPVIVVSAEKMSRLLEPRAIRAICCGDLELAMAYLSDYRPRLIPYRAVGVSSGLLVAIRSDAVRIGTYMNSGMYIALSPTAVCDSGGYDALIGGKIHEKQPGKGAAMVFAKAMRRKTDVHRRQRHSAAAAEKCGGAGSSCKNGTGR